MRLQQYVASFMRRCATSSLKFNNPVPFQFAKRSLRGGSTLDELNKRIKIVGEKNIMENEKCIKSQSMSSRYRKIKSQGSYYFMLTYYS